MLVNVTEDIANNPEAMILNRGYYGMNLRKEVSYHLSMYIKKQKLYSSSSSYAGRRTR